jgi:hypothetical protein
MKLMPEKLTKLVRRNGSLITEETGEDVTNQIFLPSDHSPIPLFRVRQDYDGKPIMGNLNAVAYSIDNSQPDNMLIRLYFLKEYSIQP